MDSDFSLVLEDCILRLRQGQSLESCLKLYPQHADRLLPLLRAADLLQAAPKIQPHPEIIQAGRTRMLAGALQHATTNQVIRSGWKLAFQLAIGISAVILLGGFFTLNASARSIPGDLLYGVKLQWEAVRLDLATSTISHQALAIQFGEERYDEIQKLIQRGRQGIVEIDGILESVQGSIWTVNGLQMFVEPDTIIDGTMSIGSRLRMQVQVGSEGQVDALKVSFYPSDVTTPGEIEASHTPQPPATEESTAIPRPGQTAAPTETVQPTHEEELEHTEEARPTEEMEPSDEPEETDEIETTDEPEETDEIEPTDEMEPTDEPEQTIEPAPTDGISSIFGPYRL